MQQSFIWMKDGRCHVVCVWADGPHLIFSSSFGRTDGWTVVVHGKKEENGGFVRCMQWLAAARSILDVHYKVGAVCFWSAATLNWYVEAYHALGIHDKLERIGEVLEAHVCREVDVLDELHVSHVCLLVQDFVEPRQILAAEILGRKIIAFAF
jgi:hypothetical protein